MGIDIKNPAADEQKFSSPPRESSFRCRLARGNLVYTPTHPDSTNTLTSALRPLPRPPWRFDGSISYSGARRLPRPPLLSWCARFACCDVPMCYVSVTSLYYCVLPARQSRPIALSRTVVMSESRLTCGSPYSRLPLPFYAHGVLLMDSLWLRRPSAPPARRGGPRVAYRPSGHQRERGRERGRNNSLEFRL